MSFKSRPKKYNLKENNLQKHGSVAQPIASYREGTRWNIPFGPQKFSLKR